MKLIRLVIWPGIAMAITACGNSGSDENATAGREAAAESAASGTVAIEVIEIVPGLSMRLLREGTGAAAAVNLRGPC